MNPKTIEEEYLEQIVIPLLQVPAAIRVERKMDEKGVLLSLTVASVDMGRIIGKQGATAEAIRNILRLFGGMNKSHISLKIEEPDEMPVPIE